MNYEIIVDDVKYGVDEYKCSVRVIMNEKTIPPFSISTVFTHELWRHGTWANGLNEDKKDEILKKMAEFNTIKYLDGGGEGPCKDFIYFKEQDDLIKEFIINN